jgi:DNA-binding response OmpR family regulator
MLLNIVGYMCCIVPGIVIKVIIIKKPRRFQNIVVAVTPMTTGTEVTVIALDPDFGDSGFETFRRLRQIPALSATPIIFITRRHDDASWRWLEFGAADYIERPPDGTAFMRRISGTVPPDYRQV